MAKRLAPCHPIVTLLLYPAAPGASTKCLHLGNITTAATVVTPPGPAVPFTQRPAFAFTLAGAALHSVTVPLCHSQGSMPLPGLPLAQKGRNIPGPAGDNLRILFELFLILFVPFQQCQLVLPVCLQLF